MLSSMAINRAATILFTIAVKMSVYIKKIPILIIILSNLVIKEIVSEKQINKLVLVMQKW